MCIYRFDNFHSDAAEFFQVIRVTPDSPPPHRVLFHEGDPAYDMYVVVMHMERLIHKSMHILTYACVVPSHAWVLLLGHCLYVSIRSGTESCDGIEI